MDFSKATIFLSGILIGSMFNTFTAISLVLIGLIIENKSLPEILGHSTPQDILKLVLIRTGHFIRNLTVHETKSKNLKSH